MHWGTRMARPMAAWNDGHKGQGQLGRGGYYPKSPKDGRRGSLRKRITTSGLAQGAARQAGVCSSQNKRLHVQHNTSKAAWLTSRQRQQRSCSRPPPPFTSLQFAASLSTILTFSPRLDLMCCSVWALVMPHSATISARGDEISTTISWNSGVNCSHT